MSEALRLSWRKALNGYRLEPRDTTGAGRHLGTISFAGTILEAVDDEPRGIFIVPRSARTKAVVIDDESTVLFDLANMRPTPQAALQFAEAWGFLDQSSEANASDFHRTSGELWNYLNLMSGDRWSELQEQVAGRSIKAGGRLRFGKHRAWTYHEPRNLRAFCFLHLMRLIDQKAAIFQCPRCGGFFTRKRNTRQTCSDACRKALSKRRRRRGNSHGLDDAEYGRIAALWQARCDILIQPDRGRAFVAKSEGADPDFLRLIGEWMIAHRPAD